MELLRFPSRPISQMTFEQFLTRQSGMEFGHAVYTDEALAQQMHRLVARTSVVAVRTMDEVVLILPNETERQLLSGSMKEELAAVPVHLHTYNEVSRELALYNATWQKTEKRVLIICHVDMYYSAAFSIYMLQLMLWKTNPQSASSLWVLTMSQAEAPEKSLVDAMSFLCPGVPVVRIEEPWDTEPRDTEPRGTEPRGTEPQSVAGLDTCTFTGNFVNYALQVLAEMPESSTVLIMCSHNEAADIKTRLQFQACTVLDNDVGSVQFLLESITHDVQARVIFLRKRSWIPLKIRGLAAVLVSGTRSIPRWQAGRIVHVDDATSQYEVDSLKAQIRCCDLLPTFRFCAPERMSMSTGHPRRRLENEQVWGFVFAACHILRNHEPLPILACFLCSRVQLRRVVKQLRNMGCDDLPIGDIDAEDVNMAACEAELLVDYLHLLDYDMHSSWFLTIGMTSSTVSAEARRAMVYIAVLAHFGFGVFDKGRLARLSEGRFAQLISRLSLRIQEVFRMPMRMYEQGIPWVALAVFQAVMQDPVHIGPDGLDLLQDGSMTLNLPVCLDVHAMVTKILGPCPFEPLAITPQDVSAIHRVMIRSWLNHSITIISSDPSDARAATLADYATNIEGAGIVQGSDELLTLWKLPTRAPRSPEHKGTCDYVAIVASLRVDGGHGKLAMSNCVVLPLGCINSWQSEYGIEFISQNLS